MPQSKQLVRWEGTERKRVEAVVEALATVGGRGESVAEVAHDARNMVTALGLYCDLLEEPGVLANPYVHYGSELRLVAVASRRLVEKLVALDASLSRNPDASDAKEMNLGVPAFQGSRFTESSTAAGNRLERGYLEGRRHGESHHWDLAPAAPIDSLAAEILANHNLLAALAGPTVTVTIDVEGGARPVRMTGEDLTRVLVNLIKNAAEAMPAGGRIQIELHQLPAADGAAEALVLTIADNGPGIPAEALETIFTSGYTTRTKGVRAGEGRTAFHRGLGLAIARSIVERSGGRIVAANRDPSGACFQIELPVRGTNL